MINKSCSKWSARFKQGGDLSSDDTLQLNTDINTILSQHWSDLKKQYRKKKADNWYKKWNNRNDRNDQKAPYIDNQGVSFLQPTEEDRDHNRGVLRHLTPAAFVAGRESEAEARARTGKWIDLVKSDSAGGEVNIRKELPRYILELKEGPGQSINWKRLFFVSAGGIGKSTTLSWLEAEINELSTGSGDEPLAFNMGPDVWGQLENSEGNDLKTQLKKILAFEFFQVIFDITNRSLLPASIRELGNEVVGLFVEPLSKELKENRAVILFDGLDHHNSSMLWALQTETESPPIVLSGRAYVLNTWSPNSRCNERGEKLQADLWTFCTLSEFDELQQKEYLGLDRFKLILPDARGLLTVPRFLKYLREDIPSHDLNGIRTPADIFYKATHHIIQTTLRELENLGGTSDRENRIVYAKALLGAIAFEMLAGEQQNQGGFASWAIHQRNIKKIESRLKFAQVGYNLDNLSEDILEKVSAFRNVISNGIIDNQSDADTFIWDNRDIQSFFIAYWLANFYDLNSADEGHLKTWIFSHVDGDAYYEINRFLADFQMGQATPLSWVSSVSAWFEPGLKNRPSEMIYRSWSKLTRLAGEPPCDWWNTPYSNLQDCFDSKPQPGGRAADWNEADPRAERIKTENYAKAQKKAQSSLESFRGELQLFLSAGSGAQKKIAEEFIHMPWRSIHGAEDFKMGAKEERQGFSKKSEAYWKERCKKLELIVERLLRYMECKNVKLTPSIRSKIARRASEKFSKEFNEKRWYDGTLGRLIRKKDVKWFAGEVMHIAEKAIEMKLGGLSPNEQTGELEKIELEVLKKIGGVWRRKDETSLEDGQKIVSFELQSVPVRHSWFNLFSPGHYENVNHYLKGKDSKYIKNETDLAERAVIFVSWFDAWAFCQWACWTDKNGNRYRCRLPHEPEWEFAARRKKDPEEKNKVRGLLRKLVGLLQKLVRNRQQRIAPKEDEVTKTKYWWGDHFYKCEEDASTTVDPNFENYAHAGGEPGMTLDSDASNIIPNGFGLKHMLGNVWEWMANVYTERDVAENPYGYSRDDPNDPESVPVNQPRSMRGGLWYFNDLMTFCTNRFRIAPGDRDYKIGFRLVRFPYKCSTNPPEQKADKGPDLAKKRIWG